MALNDMIVAVLFAAVAVCALLNLSLLRTFRRTAAELRAETERKLKAVTVALDALQVQVAGNIAVAPHVANSQAIGKIEAPPLGTKTEIQQAQEVSPEMLVVIAAAAARFLGKKIRIRSAKMLQSPYEIVNPWSQQGRVFVQASHNLRSN